MKIKEIKFMFTDEELRRELKATDGSRRISTTFNYQFKIISD